MYCVALVSLDRRPATPFMAFVSAIHSPSMFEVNVMVFVAVSISSMVRKRVRFPSMSTRTTSGATQSGISRTLMKP